MDMSRKSIAEFIGTFWLVFGGVGSALFAAGVADVGIGWLGVSLAFGLTVVTMAYGIGHISGAHLNPAVTLGVFAAGRISVKDVVPYIIAQVAGGVVAGFALWLIASGNGTPVVVDGGESVSFVQNLINGGFASNGYGDASPQGYSLVSVFVAEALLTFVFLMVILGSTDSRAPAGLAGLAIGLCLTLIHLISIPISNCSVNPARSVGTALVAMVNGNAGPISQVWLFLAAPIAGAIVAGVVYVMVFNEEKKN